MTEDEAIAIVRTAGFQRFSNALRILLNIDRWELEAAVGPVNDAQWFSFRESPWRWFIQSGDRRAAALWKIIEARQPSRIKPCPDR